MFFTLLFATFVIAAIVSALVVKVFSRPVKSLLDKIVDEGVGCAFHRYITFAGFVVGISKGVRIYALERYLEPQKVNRVGEAIGPPVLTAERWTLEIYRTVIECLQGLSGMYLAVFLFGLLAYVISRFADRRKGISTGQP